MAIRRISFLRRSTISNMNVYDKYQQDKTSKRVKRTLLRFVCERFKKRYIFN